MATICFTWELGQGYGHLVRYRALIAALGELGHDIAFLAKVPERALEVFAHLDVDIRMLPSVRASAAQRLRKMNSYAEILHNVGFCNEDVLQPQIAYCLELIEGVSPDLIIADHSPSVLLANRIHGAPLIASGTGFTVPPKTVPLRPLRYWAGGGRDQLADREADVLRVANSVLRHFDRSPMSHLAELLDSRRDWILSFPELDHYGKRDDGNYLGGYAANRFGDSPDWASTAGPKIFVYLSSTQLPRDFTASIEALDASVCLYAPVLENPQSLPESIRYMRRPVDLTVACVECDAAITNGGLNTVSTFLLAGKPQLVLPTNVERYMVGRRVELLGAGLVVPAEDQSLFERKLAAIVRDPAFHRAAGLFATQHKDANIAGQTKKMMEDINRLLVAS